MKSIKKSNTLANIITIASAINDANNVIKSARIARAKTEQMKTSARARIAASDAALARSLRSHNREIEEMERQHRLRMEEQTRMHDEASRRIEEMAREHDRQFNDMVQHMHHHHHYFM